MADENVYHIQSVTFGEEWVEIVFIESRLTSKEVVDIKSRLINPYLFGAEFAAIKEDLEDVLDRADVHRRNPQPLRRAPDPAPEAAPSPELPFPA